MATHTDDNEQTDGGGTQVEGATKDASADSSSSSSDSMPDGSGSNSDSGSGDTHDDAASGGDAS